MLRPLLNAAYWAQVQSMTDRERRRFDDALVAPIRPVQAGDVPQMAPGAQVLLGMMRSAGG